MVRSVILILGVAAFDSVFFFLIFVFKLLVNWDLGFLLLVVEVNLIFIGVIDFMSCNLFSRVRRGRVILWLFVLWISMLIRDIDFFLTVFNVLYILSFVGYWDSLLGLNSIGKFVSTGSVFVLYDIFIVWLRGMIVFFFGVRILYR